ncbi:PREDICTED: E3 ubiquitin-protein ligase RBBP6 [Tarenaya hassleriana]|uniref:E3 ubiquitin-protein ligase RBBP6 n=1 Tax=Tarenaya hassleriana TaxID=28532 RepID=UPI00053C5675|nr:PREDICTED: E3 ubiquitin-protein ligase RBBP6 [Tarenaya hassleriana]
MAIYYKFKSARDYDSIAMDGPFISVGILKDKIFETKHLGSGKDFDIVVSNAQTNEEYLDEAMLIPKNTSVLIRRVPGRPRITIVTGHEPKIENKVEDVQADVSIYSAADSSAMKNAEDEWDEFGNDLYSIPDAPVAQMNNPVPDLVPADEKVDEESKIKALIDTPALDWQRQGLDNFGPGRGYGRGTTGRMGGRGFGMERKTPPPGYVCHRCNVPGHFIQHCPTNGDPNYDIKRVKPPTGIPKSMLMANPDGSYALPSGAIAVLKPNEDAFEKEMEGLPSTTRSVGELPPELKCPLCKEVMKDAALTSKCCFQSFCDKCIRDHIIAKSMCVCGSTDVLADDLLPNKTLRDTINRILESGNSSTDNAGSTGQVQDMESARCPPPKVLSLNTSAASKGELNPAPSNINEASTMKPATETTEITSAPQPPVERVKSEKLTDACETTQGSITVKEAVASQANTQAPKEEVQQQVASGEQGRKKKKKTRPPGLPGADMSWNVVPDLAIPDYMMPMGPNPCNQYFNGAQPGFNGFHPGFNGFTGPFPGAMPPFIGYGLGPSDMAFGGVMHPDPFMAQGFGFPNIPPPHRDLSELGSRMSLQRPVMSREEFEARKAEMKRKRENEKWPEGGNVSRESEHRRMMNGATSSSPMKPKSRQAPPQLMEGYDRRRRPERLSSERPSPPRESKRSQHDRRLDERDRERPRHHERRDDDRNRREGEQRRSKASRSEAEMNHKSSVFARISYPEEEASSKRRKQSSSAAAVGHSRKETESGESSDEDRHFKRRSSKGDRSRA